MKTKLFAVSFFLVVCFSKTSFSQDEFSIEGFPDHLMYMQTVGQQIDGNARFQHIAGRRVWEPGQTLKVCFFGANKIVAELVSMVASEWSEYTSLSFDFGSSLDRRDCTHPAVGFSHIRVGFSAPGYWSLVGTDSVDLANQYQSSLNLSRFNSKYSKLSGYSVENVIEHALSSDKGTIRHEFGHAIGLLHEHQNPNLNCWDHVIKSGPNNVYAYYARYGWGRDKVERNIGLATTYDPDSIGGVVDIKDSVMSYKLPVHILKKGRESACFVQNRSNEISVKDKEWVAKFYPPAAMAAVVQDDSLSEKSFLSDVPSELSSNLLGDYLNRISIDLNSDDTLVRRDARTRLTQIISQAKSSEQLGIFVEKLTEDTYRSQLGAAVALSNSDGEIKLDPRVIAKLENILGATDEPVLIRNIESALSNTVIK